MFDEIKKEKLNFQQLFSLASVVYKKNFLYIVAVCVFVYAPMYVIMQFLPTLNLGDLTSISDETMAQMSFYVYTVSAITAVFAPLAVAAISAISKAAIDGVALTPTMIFDASLIKWSKLFVTSIVYYICVGLGSVLIIPGIFFGVYFAFGSTIVATSNTWGFNALKESKKYITGHFAETTALIIIVNVAVFVVTLLLGMISGAGAAEATTVYIVVFQVISKIVTSYFQLVTILYVLNLIYLKRNVVHSV